MLLLSRSEHKLKSVQEEIVAKYPSVAVDYATVDFSKLTPAVLDKLRAKLSGLDVGVLVNNVGVSYEFCQWFHELTDSEARARERRGAAFSTRRAASPPTPSPRSLRGRCPT